jgi:hypothetical protein
MLQCMLFSLLFRASQLHVYAKDWMGYGASSRPKFSPVGVGTFHVNYLVLVVSAHLRQLL